ncbi:MAG: class I SAM-dependent methyltransferase [Planctomycetales bacterium]|nr:class I SAM-dependent methyltransferase [Planctomycetales bacterium]
MSYRPDATSRFSDRVSDYVRYRPGYPDALVQTLVDEAGLTADATVADIGAGTGISTRLFLDLGCTVYAVEPNDAMRAALLASLDDEPRLHISAGTAEATGLPAASADLVTAGQAFHWFDAKRARREFARILKPGGQIALFWNTRQTDATPFLRAYEEFLCAYGTDYQTVRHDNQGPQQLRAFFGGDYQSRTFANEQRFDFAGLRGRLLSSSYVPAADDPGREPMLAELRRLFDRHAEAGQVRVLYETELYFGRLSR